MRVTGRVVDCMGSLLSVHCACVCEKSRAVLYTTVHVRSSTHGHHPTPPLTPPHLHHPFVQVWAHLLLGPTVFEDQRFVAWEQSLNGQDDWDNLGPWVG